MFHFVIILATHTFLYKLSNEQHQIGLVRLGVINFGDMIRLNFVVIVRKILLSGISAQMSIYNYSKL